MCPGHPREDGRTEKHYMSDGDAGFFTHNRTSRVAEVNGHAGFMLV